MACSLSGLALALAGGLAGAADPVPPARLYSQVAVYEPVFVSSKKPLPPPPAAITPPVTPAPVKPPAALTKPVSVPAPAAITGPPAPANVVVPAQVVEPPPLVTTPRVEDDLKQYQILLEPPSPQLLYDHLDSETMLEKRMRQQAMQRNPPDTVQFPDKPIVSKGKYQARALSPSSMFIEPRFVNHDRLYFEEKNAERYGWDLGFIQPVVSTAYFVKDLGNLPFTFMTKPCQRYDSSAGKCLPGDPVPYLLYPPEIAAFPKCVSWGLLAAFP